MSSFEIASWQNTFKLFFVKWINKYTNFVLTAIEFKILISSKSSQIFLQNNRVLVLVNLRAKPNKTP